MTELSHTLRRLKGHARKLVRAIAPRAAWPAFEDNLRLFTGRTGLEIGGPSGIFAANDLLPVYQSAGVIDGCNFSLDTVWQANRPDSGEYRYDSKRSPGRIYIREATNLTGLATSSYDFVLASHVLEHISSPLKALIEWRRVLKPSGVALVVVPDRLHTFDHRRPVTSFDHLKCDLEADVREDDLTHLEEILELHDLSMDRPAGNLEKFTNRSRKNYSNRCLHHHVFDQELLCASLRYSGFKVLSAGTVPPYHIVALAISNDAAH